MFKKRPSELQELSCPFCGGKDALLVIDFKKEFTDDYNVAICVKKVKKNIVGIISITGCNKTYKIKVIRKAKVIKWPSL